MTVSIAHGRQWRKDAAAGRRSSACRCFPASFSLHVAQPSASADTASKNTVYNGNAQYGPIARWRATDCQ
eukprot:3811372-Pleurochrysis_carterae.AAC.2